MGNKNSLPVFMRDPATNRILREAAECIPRGTKVYIVGGAARNAVYYRLFKRRMPQRDYDTIVYGNHRKFIENLRKKGFVYGSIRRKSHVSVMKKRVPGPKHKFRDCVFLDMSFTKESSVMKNLKENANFTINGFAINLKDVSSEKWFERVIAMPRALQDLRRKQIRINVLEKHPANLYACIRFMSQGFRHPPREEVRKLLADMRRTERWRFQRNVQKVFSYVGGRKKALALARGLGIKEDIFAWKTIEKLRK